MKSVESDTFYVYIYEIKTIKDADRRSFSKLHRLRPVERLFIDGELHLPQ